MADELETRLALLEQRLSNPEKLEDRLSKVLVLEERCNALKDELKERDRAIETLQKDVKGLQSDRERLYALRTVLAGVGITGVLVAGFLYFQVGQMESKVANTENKLATAQGAAAILQRSLDTQLQPQITQAQMHLNQFVDEKIRGNFPDVVDSALKKVTGINFLEARDYQVVAADYGNIRPDAQPPSPTKMTKDGQEFECKDPIPNGAKGAIVHVMVGRRSGSAFSLQAGQWETLSSSPGATFVAADAHGNFSELKSYQANSFSNSSSTWIGGLVFCPFFEGKKFKYRVETGFFSGPPYPAPAIPDPQIGCFATVIGWF